MHSLEVIKETNMPKTQLHSVRKLMVDGGWRTLREVAVRLGGSKPLAEASVSARLRDLRKMGYAVERRVSRDITSSRVYEYRINGLFAPSISSALN